MVTAVGEDSDGEEISHMLFANGLRSYLNLYATHPPIEQRIRALEADFDAEFYLREAVKQVADHEQAPENQGGAKPEDSDAQAEVTRRGYRYAHEGMRLEL